MAAENEKNMADNSKSRIRFTLEQKLSIWYDFIMFFFDYCDKFKQISCFFNKKIVFCVYSLKSSKFDIREHVILS